MQKRRSIATAAAVLAIAAVLAGCTGVVEPAVSFAAEKLTISVPRMVVGEAVSETLPEAMGGKQELAYSLVPVIPGLTFNPATRVLSGTPTMPGMHTMTYTAKDTETGGTMESVKFVITVDARPLTPEERIRGTWGLERVWEEDDQIVGTWVDFLTFTKTRFILVRSHFDTGGNFEYAWKRSGEWEITDQEIVSIFYHNHDDNDDTPEIPIRLTKSYLLASDGLLVHHWASSEPDEREYDRFTRVSDQHLSLPPLGVWVHHDVDIDTMTVNRDGTFVWSEQYTGGTWTLTAEWEVRLDNYFINLTNATATWTGTGEEPEPDNDSIIHMARYLRFAYAPAMGEAGERMIALSFFGDELDNPYGDYWREMRQQQ